MKLFLFVLALCCIPVAVVGINAFADWLQRKLAQKGSRR
jgi:hypothetical protein